MPKIVNKEYLQFLDGGYIEIVTNQQLQEWLTKLETSKLPRKCTLPQARALLIALVVLGRRPSEIADIKGKDIQKMKLDNTYCYKFDIKTLKGGKNSPLFRPITPLTKELYEYITKRPEDMYAFWAFRKTNPNKVNWKTNKNIMVKQEHTDGTNSISTERYSENKSKTYIRKGGLINYYSTLWTGKPSYYFRHQHYSSMYANGANDAEVQLDKGAKDPKSINAYKHMSKKMAKNILRITKL
jgi:integrase